MWTGQYCALMVILMSLARRSYALGELDLGESECTSAADQCADTNTECSGGSPSVCQCTSGYYDNDGNIGIGGACIQKVDLGQPCTSYSNVNNQCTADNAACLSETCQCSNGFYRSGTNSCTAMVDLGQPCTTYSNVNNQCTAGNAACLSGTCQCSNGFYQSGTNTCITKVYLGQSCTTYSNVNNQCTTGNAACLSGTCQCSNGFYRSGTNSCTAKVDLGLACILFYNVNDQCTAGNAACLSGTCQCSNGFYQSGTNTCTAKVDLGQSCTTHSNVNNQCKAGNAACLGTCQCNDGFYQSGTNTCTAKVNLGQSCTAYSNVNNQCTAGNAACLSGTCQCSNGFYQSGANTCFQKVDLGQSCTAYSNVNNQCTTGNASCQSGTCQCSNGFYQSGANTCPAKVGLGYNCPNGGACATANAVCSGSGTSGSTCMCGANYYDTNTAQSYGRDCRPKIPLFSNCENEFNRDQCKDPNANCASTADCRCNSGYHNENVEGVQICEANKALGVACTTAPECSDPNADCLDSKCTCKTGFYDSNHYTSDGGNCYSVSQLRVLNIQFTVSTTYLGISWNPPSEGKDQYIDEYTVAWTPKGNSVTGLSQTVISSSTTLTELTPGDAYSVTVASVNKRTRPNALRSTYVTVEQSTEPNPPTASSLSQVDLDARDTSIQLSWTRPAIGVVTIYEIELLTVDNNVITTVTSSTNNTYVTDSSLLNGFQYNVAIKSRSEGYLNMDSQMIYVWSKPLQFGIKTTVQVPDPPTNVVCGETTYIYIPLTWTAPTYPNGDLVKYYIHVYSSQNNLLKVVSTSHKTTSAQIGDLEPGTYYNFRVYTENEKYNSSLYGQTYSCKTKPRMSDAPQDLTITRVTSRVFTVSWGRPNNTYSEELLGYVLRIKEGDSCVQEVKYKCSDCTGSFDSAASSSRACKGGEKTDESKSEAELQTFTLTFSSNAFKPDTDYTILVAAVTGIGWGHQALQSVRSKEEEPQEPPKAVNVFDIGKTSFNVSWSLIGPRPGRVTYKVILTADTGAEAKTYTVKGYDNKTLIADGLEEYWYYTVSVTARTNVGNAKTSDTTQKFRTLPSAPGAVTEFEAVTAQQRSDNFHKMTIRWKAPSLLERNSVIKEYVLKHNVRNTISNSGVSGQWQSLPFESKTGDVFYSQVFDVIPESTYQFEVYAVNIESRDNIGVKMTISEMAPAGFPVNIEEADPILLVVKESSKDQTFISLNLVMEFFTEETNGRVQRTALLGCKSSACPENFLEYAATQEKVDALANWQKAAQSGLYRITSADWLTKYKRRRRSTYTEVPFTVGTENCDGVTEGTYCNGPLEPETEYIFVAVVCTSTGCTISKKYGPFITEEAVPQPVGMIVGIVVGIIAILAIAVVVVFILRKHRNKTPTMSREHGVEMENNTDLVLTKDGIRLIVYENVISGNQGELKAAGQTYSTVNISGCWSENDYKLCFAPTTDNVNQFWTMIFEEEVHTIVMFAESKTPKKELRYWPSDFNEPIKYRHVDLEVTYLNTNHAYTHTKMNISNRGTARTINHYQCSPVSTFSPDGFVDFVKCVGSNFKTGRILLHSSEGMASTVPFLVLDTCIQQLSEGPLAEKVDVYKMLVNIVKTRKDLMPPQELFIFTHDCVQSLGSCDYAPLQNTAQNESVYQTLQVDD